VACADAETRAKLEQVKRLVGDAVSEKQVKEVIRRSLEQQ
jgi:hypothetical protein